MGTAPAPDRCMTMGTVTQEQVLCRQSTLAKWWTAHLCALNHCGVSSDTSSSTTSVGPCVVAATDKETVPSNHGFQVPGVLCLL